MDDLAIIPQEENISKNKSKFLKLKLSSPKGNKYSNNFIFTKREMAFNESLEKNKTNFIYKKCSLFDGLLKNKNIGHNANKMNNLKKNKSSNSPLYLTECKEKNKNINNKSITHSFRGLNKPHFFESDKSHSYFNYTNLENYSNKNNSLFNDYISFCRGQSRQDKSSFINSSNNTKINNNRKINLKLYNPKYLLNIYELGTRKDKQNKKRIELEYKQLFKKRFYLNNYIKKENKKQLYIDSFKDYLKEKINLTALKEKKNHFKEEIENKLTLIESKTKEVKKNYEDFNEIFFVKFYEYIKILSRLIKKGRIENENYIDLITLLKKKKSSLELEMNKNKIKIIYLNKFALLNAKIHLKKLELPKYYENIFENKKIDLNKDNLTEKDINNIIIKYKKNINYNEMLSLLTKYENYNLDLLKEYNYLCNDINILKKRKKDLINNLEFENEGIEKLINIKIKKIIELKSKNEELTDEKNLLISYYTNKDISSNNNTNKQSTRIKRKSSIIINYNQIYLKIISIYNNLSEYINFKLDYIKRPKSTDKDQTKLLYNLKKIEVLVDILIQKIKTFKEENLDKKKYVKKMMEKYRKIRNDSRQKQKRELSLKLMKKKLEEKNKRIITIKKVNIYNYNSFSKYKNRNKSKKVIKIDNIFDYLNH